MRSAVLVIDIQNDYCHPEGKMSLAGHDLGWLQKTVNNIRSFLSKLPIDVQVFYIRTVCTDDISEFEKRKQEQKGILGICEPGSWGADFYLLTPIDEQVITKNHYSAFFGTDILKNLEEAGIDELVIIGTSTHICVDSTVRDAYQHEFSVVVLDDLVATRESERRFHDTAIELMRQQYARVMSSNQFLKSR